MTRSDQVKEKIIEATIGLINESEGDVAHIGTRAIAERAGVGLGMVNYHFQTKERLVEICVERIIGDVIGAFRPEIPSASLSPSEKAGLTAKQVADFLFDNPAVSRISILSDLKNPKVLDNTIRSVMGLESTLSSLDSSEEERHITAFALVSAIQALFLRQELFGLDMKTKEQRDKTIDVLAKRLFAPTVTISSTQSS